MSLSTSLTIVIIMLLHLGFTIFGDSASPYYPVDDIAINCGSSGNSTALDGREWIGDATSKSTSSPYLKGKSTSSRALYQYLNADNVPYMSARFSRSQFTYTFHVSPGQKFIRLHFYPFSYMGFEASKSYFSVKAGAYTLLSNFSASLTAESLGVKFFAKEFCVNIDDNQSLSITFSPTSSTNSKNVYAFVNGIEVVSMPIGLYYSLRGDLGAPVLGDTHRFFVDNKTALETVHRLNIGGRSILPIEDLGMYRSWSDDRNYLSEFGVVSFRTNTMIKYSNLRTYVAPMRVYQTTWSMSPVEKAYEMYNLAWKLPVDSGFRYLVRLHFYELEFGEFESVQRDLVIFINNLQIAAIDEGGIKWSGGSGCPVYRDYVVMMEGDRMEGKRDLIIALCLNPKHESRATQNTALLNGLEIFKLSNPDNNLAGPNPGSMTQSLTSWTSKLRRLILAFGSGDVIAAIVTLVLTLINTIVYQLNHYGTNSGKKNTSSPCEEKLCRRFSLMEIQVATKNFDDALVVGIGGFGKVYKGRIDHGALTVAIKRLKLESKQGALEFWTEIEMLSTYQNAHLVSLIGYCNERQEMLLVYEYMAHGSLADHLHKIHNINGNGGFPLSWEQRLRICIGAARGLDYLHSVEGARHGLIHRDVKSSNILLDENWVAKISDLGLSKMNAANLSCTHISTDIKGTFGYLDPNYYMTRRLTSKSDVFGFGVILFEALCGRPAVDTKLEEEQHSLVLWAKKCITEGKLDLIVDPSVREHISQKSLKAFAEIANKCLLNLPNERPTMAEVVNGLEFELKRQESAFSITEEEDSNEQTSPTSPTTEVNMCNVDQTTTHEAIFSTKTGISQTTSNATSSGGSNASGNNGFSTLSGGSEAYLGGQILSSPNLRIFSFSELKVATRKFRNDRVLGEGSFGKVYKGFLYLYEKASSKNPSRSVIAVKRLNSESMQGLEEWQSEVNFLGRLSHPNLVKLLGYCWEDKDLLLVYEFMQKGSLENHLFGRGSAIQPLLWDIRLKILIGAARGLEFLHTSKKQVIYRDFKASNILLDGSYNPKISDFGLAKMGPSASQSHVTTRVMGTYGYAAPEYVATGHLYVKSDVYGFGVVLVEMLTGLRALDTNRPSAQHCLVDWIKPYWRQGIHSKQHHKLKNTMDSRLEGRYPFKAASQIAQLALKCLEPEPKNRPSMKEVVETLERIEAVNEGPGPRETRIHSAHHTAPHNEARVLQKWHRTRT